MPAMAQMARPSHAAPAGLDRGVLHHAFPSPPGALDFSDQTEHGKVFLLGGMCSAHLDSARSNGESPKSWCWVCRTRWSGQFWWRQN
mmetsp:Transcript_27332/g.45072  ORF Transcript_27332/g.45072 Transcript_27332/m.45072 type:complete len:87 (+) Transcript_27332:292-552(+)